MSLESFKFFFKSRNIYCLVISVGCLVFFNIAVANTSSIELRNQVIMALEKNLADVYNATHSELQLLPGKRRPTADENGSSAACYQFALTGEAKAENAHITACPTKLGEAFFPDDTPPGAMGKLSSINDLDSIEGKEAFNDALKKLKMTWDSFRKSAMVANEDPLKNMNRNRFQVQYTALLAQANGFEVNAGFSLKINKQGNINITDNSFIGWNHPPQRVTHIPFNENSSQQFPMLLCAAFLNSGWWSFAHFFIGFTYSHIIQSGAKNKTRIMWIDKIPNYKIEYFNDQNPPELSGEEDLACVNITSVPDKYAQSLIQNLNGIPPVFGILRDEIKMRPTQPLSPKPKRHY